METLECKAGPSRSRGADAPEPSDRERQRCRRAKTVVHQRDDQRRNDADSKRSERARETSDERVALRRENAERMGFARRERQDASHLDWSHLHVHARPSPRAIRLGAAHLCSIAEPGCCVGRRSPCAVAMEGSRPLPSLRCLKAGKRCFGRLPSGTAAGSTTTSLR